MDQAEQSRPSWEEAFKGRDVVRGGELVNNLLYEGVGLPVYDKNLAEKKTRFLIDREIGEEDFSVRRKEENDRRLLGLIIPTETKNEFVFLGVGEGSFTFWVADHSLSNFHKDSSTSLELNWRRFGDYASSVQDVPEPWVRKVLKEEDDPSRFMEVVVSSVEKERERMQSIREKRADVREDLMKRLFGKQG